MCAYTLVKYYIQVLVIIIYAIISKMLFVVFYQCTHAPQWFKGRKVMKEPKHKQTACAQCCSVQHSLLKKWHYEKSLKYCFRCRSKLIVRNTEIWRENWMRKVSEAPLNLFMNHFLWQNIDSAIYPITSKNSILGNSNTVKIFYCTRLESHLTKQNKTKKVE